MRDKLIKAAKSLAVGIFVVGLVTAGIGYVVKYARAQSHAGFRATYNQTFVSADGSERTIDAVSERHQRSDGTWKEITTYYNPDSTVFKTRTIYGLMGRGVFKVDDENKQMFFLGAAPDRMPVFSEAKWRQSPNFAGEGSVLGYKTLVEHIPEPEGSGYMEFHTAPALNGASLKSVFASGDGHMTVIEATNIEVGEPPASVFAQVPDYPVNYGSFERGIQAAESIGNQKMSEEMRQTLQKQKGGRP